MPDLIKAWDQVVVSTGTYGAGEYTLSYSMLKTVRSWELYYLRKVLRRTFRWSENRVKYMRDSTKAIDKIRERQSVPHMFHRMSTMYMKNWYRVMNWEDNNGNNFTRELREHKDHRW